MTVKEAVQIATAIERRPNLNLVADICDDLRMRGYSYNDTQKIFLKCSPTIKTPSDFESLMLEVDERTSRFCL